MNPYYAYIFTNASNNVLYTGSTDSLYRRWTEHVTKFFPNAFTARYNVNKLVWYEEFKTAEEAIAREYQIKGGSRKKKIDLIVSKNPLWNDLAEKEFGWIATDIQS
ncbi:MAG: Excinuclease subunit domain protein [Bacteroidetes bacterium]|nr:Excinuclease subunit domain protein [Bacteroidota bacterium]